mmetsp:Transcript_74396/g.215040  ORF Transcript_74396/g.215040 Transcript_74396/m.215040 type:complete len:311 (-) Transcript_74396:3386-4318(-)
MPFEAAENGVRLLLAALRPGHEPAHRPYPGGQRHVAGVPHRPGEELVGPAAGVMPPDLLGHPVAVPAALQRPVGVGAEGLLERDPGHDLPAHGRELTRPHRRPRHHEKVVAPRAPGPDLQGGGGRNSRRQRRLHRAFAPFRGGRSRSDLLAPRGGRAAPAPHHGEVAHQRDHHRGGRRRFRAAPLLLPPRLRRRRDLPIPMLPQLPQDPRVRFAFAPAHRELPPCRGVQHLEGDVQDGDLLLAELQGRAALPGHRHRPGGHDQVLPQLPVRPQRRGLRRLRAGRHGVLQARVPATREPAAPCGRGGRRVG